jgi:hypothetical protein
VLWSRAVALSNSLGSILWFDPRREHSSVPTALISQLPRAGAVKVGRRSAIAACSTVCRPRLDRPEHGGMLDRLGLQGADICMVMRGIGWPASRAPARITLLVAARARAGDPWQQRDQVFFFSPALRRRLSPLSSMRWALCTMRSNIASPRVGSAMMSCHCASGTWLVIKSDPLS